MENKEVEKKIQEKINRCANCINLYRTIAHRKTVRESEYREHILVDEQQEEKELEMQKRLEQEEEQLLVELVELKEKYPAAFDQIEKDLNPKGERKTKSVPGEIQTVYFLIKEKETNHKKEQESQRGE